MKNINKIYILGAGVTGLALGKFLSEKGIEVEIFEKEKIIGGLSRTTKWKNFNVDFGPHIFHTVDKELEKLWEKEFGNLFVKQDFWCKNIKGSDFKRFYDYPLSYESINEYPASLKNKILYELKQTSLEERSLSTNYREYVRALVGETLQEMFFEDYPKKLWGIPTSEMTANWAPKRIEIRKEKKPFYTGRWNAVGKYATGCILEKMAETIKKNNGKIHLNSGVNDISFRDNFIAGFKLSNNKKINLETNELLISTIPINIMAELLNIKHKLKFRGVIAVTLSFSVNSILPKNTHFLYYDNPNIIFHRISEQKKFSSAGFPLNKTFLTAEIAYTQGDDLDKTSSNEIIKKVLNDIIKAELTEKKYFIKGLVVKNPNVYPLLINNYEHLLRTVKSKMEKYTNLYCVGGPAEYNYSDIHINFLKAIDLAELITEKHSEFYKNKKQNMPAYPKNTVLLNSTPVGDGHRPFIIAEAGLNHNGNLVTAFKLIDEAKKAGCNAVKFQVYKADERVSEKIKKAKYAEKITGLEESIYDMLNKLELSKDDLIKIFAYGKKTGIDVFATPFGFYGFEILESLKIPYYKIASSDLNNLPLIKNIAQTGKPIILSTGMSTLGEIEETIQAILNSGNDNIILLHCLSSYPAEPEEVNLNVIKTLKNNYRVPVGFSDHTPAISVSSAALTIGANVIERHFTLDRKMEGPDHIFSSEPNEMKELVSFANQISLILGDGIKRIQPSEFDTINSFKKSIYAKKEIRKNEIITEDMLIIKGPAGGLMPKYRDIVIGRKAVRKISADHPVTWDDI